jgi:hypothetical protein
VIALATMLGLDVVPSYGTMAVSSAIPPLSGIWRDSVSLPGQW